MQNAGQLNRRCPKPCRLCAIVWLRTSVKFPRKGFQGLACKDKGAVHVDVRKPGHLMLQWPRLAPAFANFQSCVPL
eukprot:scaffold52751_cov21-Tisochrysis_lutea.AAC.1